MTVPDIKTSLPGPRAAELIARDARHVSPSYTRGYPLVMAGGQGAVVEDVDGNRFLDCAAGIAVNATGHSHPEVVKAIVDQAQRFLHMSGTDFYYEPQVRLAEEMSSIAPMDGPVRSFFGNSGTEAVEASLKLAKWYTKRHNIIAFLGSFHGRTSLTMAMTGKVDEGLRYVAEGLEDAERTSQRLHLVQLKLTRGDLLLWSGQPAAGEVEACYLNALDLAREFRTPMLELRAATRVARVWTATGREKERAASSRRSSMRSLKGSTCGRSARRGRCSSGRPTAHRAPALPGNARRCCCPFTARSEGVCNGSHSRPRVGASSSSTASSRYRDGASL